MTTMRASVLSMIEGSVRANPRALAVVDGQRACDYSELVSRAAAIDVQLAAVGLVRGDAVGICMQRGIEWIAAMLALLRAGMVYVPLPPGLPLARQREMCAIAGVRHVLADVASEEFEASIVVSAATPPVQAAISSCETPPHPQAPAYLIFTSGTSGTPKAVTITHRNLEAHAHMVTARYALTAQDRVLQTCAIGFDISIEEVIPTLCAGATIIIAPDHVGQRDGGLGALLDAYDVTVANLPTALWSAWVDELATTPRTPLAIRCVIVGGEACPVVKVREWLMLDLASRVTCINAYGPTETTITTTAWTMRTLPATQLHVPIGHALPGIEASVLDESLYPSVAGELYLRGALVGDGYRGQPAATAAVFLPDPFSRTAGARMYRSGDAVQRGDDGELVLSGRTDRQIKLRGHRIEPAEIERRLESSGLLAAVAVALATQGEGRTLVAYVVPRAHEDGPPQFHGADTPAVARYAEAVAALPDYMRPRWYCLLAKLPLNGNGKTDFHALPTLPQSATAAAPDDVFLACVQQCLGYMPEDLSHNFHAAGGDSIQAVQLLALLRQRGWHLDAHLLVSMPLLDSGAALRPHAPVACMAPSGDCIGVHLDTNERQRLKAGTPRWHDIEQIWATTHVQLGMLYRSLTGKREGQYIEQVEGVLEDLNVAVFKAAWNNAIARHPILRVSFALALRDKPLLLVHRTVKPEWQMSVWPDDTSDLPRRIADALAEDRARGIDLLVAPLLRFQLARIGPRHHHFIWTYHHALLDGWSDIAVLDTVFEHYDALIAQALPQDTPGAPFCDYVTWLQAQDRSAALAYWSKHLAVLPARRTWLLADPAGSPSGHVLRREYRFDAQHATALSAYAQAAGATLNTLLLAAWASAVGAVCGTSDVVLGTVVATRPPAMSDRIVGPLLNVLPLRFRADRVSASSLVALQRTQAERQPHTHIGLDQITVVGDPPLFDTLFVFENYPPARHRSAAALRSHAQTDYPLSLLVWPGDGLRIEMLYDPGLLDASMLDRLCDALHVGIDAIFAPASPGDAQPVTADDVCMELVI